MSQQCAPSQIESPALQRLRFENEELRRYLEAQKSVISSLERRVGRSLRSLGVNVEHMASFQAAIDWQNHLESVKGEVDSLCDLLADAMLLQKMEAGKVEAHLEPLAIETVVTSVTRHLLEPKSNTPVRLVCEISSPLSPILADSELLEAVLMDLLGRSLKYSDQHAPVILGIQQIDRAVHLQITAQRFAPVGDRDFATEIVLCCRRVEVQQGKITCQQRFDGSQTVTIVFEAT